MTSRHDYNEKEYLQAVAQGDEVAFAEVFHRYRNKVYTIALNITRSEPVAEEILLDVFLKVWLKREQLYGLEHFSAWLFTITRNRVFSTLKQMAQDKRATLVDEELLTDHENPNSRLLDKEYQKVLQQAVAGLSPQQKKVYHLIREGGLKREEAAQQLNLSPETVKRHLSEAMQFIRAYCLSHLGVYGTLVVLVLPNC
ncbi:sigma-70 family RNA polymerase sigma factor [Chitinophaga horti]|uniref:Sigma-70 family RNA polymerase sigma factor n=1 Tax=Chitinophaga horti TaxID=2920382 RepID=A0ABY6J7W2_9BACT|nr:sigma-70 family RNA polymerase sigma factor [Chitinophaga horti]UYQ95764.1 sigma-70 family RNA polymerase sigma factor [Chitinophaga horti]